LLAGLHNRNSNLQQTILISCSQFTIQQKIAHILSAYDDLIENNRRINILEEMAQMIYREWFVNCFPGHEKAKMVYLPLGKIPEGWEVVTLGDVVEIKGKI
jgi:type I restriction enzyme S subunit